MAVDLAKYIVSLEAQTQQYVQQLDRANRKLDAFHRDQTRALSKVKEAFIGFGQGIIAALSIQAVARFTAESIRMADALGKSARAAGITAEELQRLRFAFSQLGGVTSQQADIGLQRFNRTLGLALTGSKEAATAFRSLGVAIAQNGRARGTQAALDDTLRALAAIPDSATRAARASKLFGEELGPKLAASLAGGIAAVDNAKRQIAGVISDETIRKAERLNDQFERFSVTLGGALKGSLVDFAAGIAGISGEADTLAGKLEEIDKQIGSLRNARTAGQASAGDLVTGIALEAPSQEFVNRELARLAEERRRITNQMFLDELDQWANQPAEIARVTRDGFKRINFRPDFENLFDFLEEDGLSFLTVDPIEIPVSVQLQNIEQLESFKQFTQPIKNNFDDLFASIREGGREAFADWLYDGELKFKDFLRRLAAEFAASQIFSALGTVFAGGGGGPIASFFGKIFGGSRDTGGPVSPGKIYEIGKGPYREYFSPGTTGRIDPIRGGNVTNINVDARGATDPAAVEAAVVRAVQISSGYTDTVVRNIYRTTFA